MRQSNMAKLYCSTMLLFNQKKINKLEHKFPRESINC